MSDLDGKKVLVTGSSQGIGSSIALAVARQGADVVINCRERIDLAEQVSDRVRALGRQSLVVRADVTNRQQVQNMFATIIETWKRVDVLVTNVGHAYYYRIEEMKPEQWYQTIDENLTSQMYCIQAALPYMLKHGSGRVIAFSSISAQRGSPSGDVGYSACKAGIVAMVKTLASQYATKNITFNIVSPGIIDAGLTKKMPSERRVKLIETIPMKRLGNPDEIGEVVAFLASERASYITGQTIAVNGGLYM
jgi:3-oxoacyl-[acyl-carrier protein] reductase